MPKNACWASQVLLVVKNPTAKAGDLRQGFDHRIRKIPWRRAWQPIPVLSPGESHGQRSLAGYSLWGRKVTTEGLSMHSYHGYYPAMKTNELFV